MPSEPTFPELLEQCRHDALHLELRDAYAVEGDDVEEFAAWRGGRRWDPEERGSWWHPFYAAVEAAVARGVAVRRLKVVSEPVTEYMRYMHHITGLNVAVGEQVRWLPRATALEVLLTATDFWVFDDRVVRWHLFDGDGGLVGHRFDAGAAGRCREVFEAAWARAVPHDEFKV